MKQFMKDTIFYSVLYIGKMVHKFDKSRRVSWWWFEHVITPAYDWAERKWMYR